MKDQLITFETAKLAKEKEFDYDMGWDAFFYDPSRDNQLIHGSERQSPHELDDYSSQTAAQIEYTPLRLHMTALGLHCNCT